MKTEWKSRIISSGLEDPAQLLANPYNFRYHPKHQKDALTGTLDEIGWIQDVIVNKTTGHIIDGHLRVTMATEHGSMVPVKYVELTEAEEMIALATIDPIGALATQDQAELDQLVEDIGTVANEDLSEFLQSLLSDGLEDDDEEEEGLTEDDEAPDTEPTSKVKPGDVWVLGNHRIMCGDSLSLEDIAQLMDGDQADCLWIDPPYNVDYEGSGGKKIDNDNMGDGEFRQFLREMFTSCATVMKPGAPFYIAHADSEGYNFRGAAEEAGLGIRQCLIWVKNSLVLGRQDHQWIHEPILYGWKPGAAHKWYGEFNKTTVIDDQPKIKDMDRAQMADCIRELRNAMNTTVIREDKPKSSADHPTMKPVRLITTQLRNSTRKGDIVIDFCGGSGSTLIACEKLGRHARLCELSPTYAQVIVKRWQEFTGQKAVHKDTGQYFDDIEV